VFLVPDETLVAADARRLGVAGAGRLFGGVVPYRFVATKAITHGVIGPEAARPRGWSDAFAARVGAVVLPGYTAFSVADARRAAAALLRHGSVRTKQPLAAGGRGQALITTPADVDAAVDALGDDDLRACGLVLELDLADATTLSVGQVSLGDLTITYHGTQRTTADNDGRTVYGGSDLVCVRGGWQALARQALDPNVRHAVAQARAYDAATALYRGFAASRRNYDVGQGTDADGRRRSGVFEASWRAGGASAAEVAAFQAFVADDGVAVVHARCLEVFGRDQAAPSGATVQFHGEDPTMGPLLRYAEVTRVEPRAP
jgi:hypothetical protein